MDVRPTVRSNLKEGTFSVVVKITEQNGTPVTLENFAWEYVMPGSNREADHGYCSDVYSSDKIKTLFGSAQIPAYGTLEASSVWLGHVSPSDSPIVFKLVGRDRGGNMVSAWDILELVPSATSLAKEIASDYPSSNTSSLK